MEPSGVEGSAADDIETFPALTGPIIAGAMRRGWELVEERIDGARLFREDGVKALHVQAIGRTRTKLREIFKHVAEC